MPKPKNQNKYFKDQYDDEEVLLAFRKHPVIMRKGLILSMIVFVVCILPTFLPSAQLSYFYIGIAAGIFLGILAALPSWIYWYFSLFILTDQRFIQIIQKGFFKKSFSDIGVKQIQSVNYHIVGLQETLLGFGTIVIQTYLGEIVIHDVHHPEKTTKELSLLLRDYGALLDAPSDDAQKGSREI